jgi:ubiquinone/menaquinone biosynthesis C-methylase UbiE
VDEGALKLFSMISRWTGGAAAFRVSRILGTKLRPGMNALDIGTGPGLIPLNLKRFYAHCHFLGLDLSMDMLRAARGHCRKKGRPLSLVAADGEALPFRDNAIHVITSFFALHHMDRPERLLGEVDRVLRGHGSVLIMDFRRDMSGGLYRLLDLLWQIAFFHSAGRFGFRDSVHSAWRPDEIRGILTRNGLGRFIVHTNGLELWIVTADRN